MGIFEQEGLAFLSRYAHVIAGITWIGLLYYFNFVQVPAFAGFEAPARNEALAKLAPRALWWFRWGAVLTVLFGVTILAFNETLTDGDYWKSAAGLSISTGIAYALVMFVNVWGIIWRNQKTVIANAQGLLAGREADPAAAGAGRKAVCASRTNAMLSIPMLFFMVATSHFVGAFYDTSESGDRVVYYLVALVILAVAEVIALRAPAAGKPEAWHIDAHKNTLIAGSAITVVLYLVLEILFG